MEQKSLARWLKLVFIGVGLCGCVLAFVILPVCGQSIVQAYPEVAGRFWPWLVFLWLCCLPVAAALVLGWRIASNIGADRSFSLENARLLKWIAWLAAGDAGFFSLGNLVLLVLNMSHPSVVLASALVVFAAVAAAVAAAALSHLVHKAALLQEQSDLTI